MSTNKADTIHALCLAHRIAQYEAPPPDKYIQIKYRNRALDIVAHLTLKVSHKVIKNVNVDHWVMPENRTYDSQVHGPPTGGREITPTSVTEFSVADECGDYSNIKFMIEHKGKEHHYVMNPDDLVTKSHCGSDKFVVNLLAPDDGSIRVFTQTLRTNGLRVMLRDLMYFDKNARLITRIPVIDGWDFRIKYINYEAYDYFKDFFQN